MLAFVLAALWLPPVDGPVLRAFVGGPDPFARGLRRAVVLRAAPGQGVRAPCGGRVLFAGRTPGGPAVTLRCGARRATLMPVRAAVRRGGRVRKGALVGEALGNVGLSVRRRDGGYVDPGPLLATPLGPAPPAAPVRVRRPRVRPLRGGEALPRIEPRAEPVRAAGPARAVPWPAWAGLGLVLAASGAGVRVRARRRPGGPARARAPARAA